MMNNIVVTVLIQCVTKSGTILPIFLALSTKRIISPSVVIADVVFVTVISGACVKLKEHPKLLGIQ